MLDQDTFMDKVDEYAQVLYRTARSMLCHEEDCNDALQEAITKAWASRDSLRNEAYFRTWMMRILINECHNIQKHRKRVLPSDAIEDTLQTSSSICFHWKTRWRKQKLSGSRMAGWSYGMKTDKSWNWPQWNMLVPMDCFAKTKQANGWLNGIGRWQARSLSPARSISPPGQT